MKTNLLKSFLATVMLGSMALAAAAEDAPDYKPLLTDGKSWLMAIRESFYEWKYDTHFMVEVKGDTIIGDLPCKHLESYYIGRESERTSLFAYENDRKVYIVNFWKNSETPVLDLLMDFTMTAGDSKPLIDNHGQEHEKATRTVTDDKTITAQGEDYRILQLRTTFCEESSAYGETGCWVEGIGTLNVRDIVWSETALNSLPTTADRIHTIAVMVSCYQDGKKIFDYSDFNGETYTYNEPARILSEGKSWLIGAVLSNMRDELRYVYSVGADTIVGGKSCKIIDFFNVDKPEEKGWLIACEVNGRVFKVADEEHPMGPDEIPGTFQPILDTTNQSYTLKLHAYDYISGLPVEPESDGKYGYDAGIRSFYALNHSVLPNRREIAVVTDRAYGTICWVEGVGASVVDFSLTSFPVNSSAEGIDYRYMIECYQDGKCIFTRNDFSRPVDGIEEVSAQAAAADGAAYDLQGRRLTKPAPGQLYIRDGRLRRN